MPVKKKSSARKRRKRTGAKKNHRIDLKPVQKTMRAVKAKLAPLAKTPPGKITEEHLKTARDIATAMQDVVSGLREAIKRAAMADGQLAPGKTITSGGRLVYVKLRPGCKEGSKDPDDYDLVTEPIQ